MLKTKNNVVRRLVSSLFFVVAFLFFPSISVYATPISSLNGETGIRFDSDNGKSRVIIDNSNYVLDGYDFAGIDIVYINAANTVIKNGTNISQIIVNSNGTGSQILFNNISGGEYGILVESATGIVIDHNTINGVLGPDAIRIQNTVSCSVTNNIVTNSARYAIEIQNDNGSTVSYNTFSKNCIEIGVPSDGTLIYGSQNTNYLCNTISDTKAPAVDWGNGLIVGKSANVTVSGNIVSASGNHGIQASWEANGVTISNNTVTNSANDGISVSRGSKNISISNNEISNNVGYGIVIDAQDGYEGKTESNISATISGNKIIGSTEGAIYSKGVVTAVPTITIYGNVCQNNYQGLSVNGTTVANVDGILIENCNLCGIGWRDSAQGTLNNTTIRNFGNCGISLEGNARLNVFSSEISMPNRNNSASGIVLYRGSGANIDGCKIYNCSGTSGAGGGIVAYNGSSVSAKNNQVCMEGKSVYAGNSYLIQESANSSEVVTEKVYELIIGASQTSEATYHANSSAGVLVNGIRYEEKTGSNGKVTISYPSQPSTDGIVAYVSDGANNYSIMNAPIGFDINTYTNIYSKHSQIVGFVTRLYNICLDREPDEGGLNHWVELLESGQRSGIQIANSFIFSVEFKGKNYCNDCFISHLYRAFMGREADTGGYAHWQEVLRNGITREEVFNRFAYSEEFRNICSGYGITLGEKIPVPNVGTIPTGTCAGCGEADDITLFIKRLYNVTLDREPDDSGMAHWQELLRNGAVSGTEIARRFIFSVEYVGKNYPDDVYIEYLYNAMMGRASDEGGKQHWLEVTANGLTREEMFYRFANSPEFSGICSSYGIVWK